MRALSVQVKVTLAIVLSLLIIDGVGAAVAQYNFHESESQHALDASRAQVQATARVLDLRLRTLGQAAADAAEAVNARPAEDVQQTLRRAGFGAAIREGPDGLVWTMGDATGNESLIGLLTAAAPVPSLPGRVIAFKDGWLVVGARSLNAKNVVVGAIDRDTLSNTFLNDLLIGSDGSNVIVTNSGDIVAAASAFAGSDDPARLGEAEMVRLGDNEDYLVAKGQLAELQGFVAHTLPTSMIDERVNALVYRFVMISTGAVIIAGIASVITVAIALRPLRQITDAARRLGSGDEDLRLTINSRDEMGVLARVLDQSARAIGDARKQQEAHADELRITMEDFQVAVGGLARSVGEADTAPEIANRLAEAILLVTPTAAVAIFQKDELLELRLGADEGERHVDEHSVRALLGSDADAFRWHQMKSTEDEVRVALLPRGDAPAKETESRKVEILLNQAALAFHRARTTNSLRKARDDLDQLLRQKQVYLDILSHDLKNPIAVARGRTEMLTAKHPETADKTKPIEQALDRATKIIEEAVLFSKLEREKQLDRPVVDLTTLAQEAAHSLSPLAATRGIEIVCSAPEHVPWRANHLIVRAIENILSNAIKWSPERSTIVIDVEPSYDACKIRVVDHGPGIPPEDRPRLFARFERADRSGVKGVGLGLAIAKRVVAMHEGRIAIEDTPGGGCTFVIILPAEPQSGSDESRSQSFARDRGHQDTDESSGASSNTIASNSLLASPPREGSN